MMVEYYKMKHTRNIWNMKILMINKLDEQVSKDVTPKNCPMNMCKR